MNIIKLLMLLMLMSLIPEMAWAQTYTDPTTHLMYTVSGTSATIIGMESGYKAIVIPATVSNGSNVYNVTAVGKANSSVGTDSPFYSVNDSITSLDLSGATNLTTIARYAFLQLYRVTGDIAIPPNVSSIGFGAFQSDYNVRSFVFKSNSNSHTINLDANVFSDCLGLEYIDMSSFKMGTFTMGTLGLSRSGSGNSSTFSGIGEHTIVYLPYDDAAGTLAKDMADDPEPNYAVHDGTGGFTCQHLALYEDAVTYHYDSGSSEGYYHGGFFIPYLITADTITYERSIKAGRASTVYLPYDFDLGSGMKGYKLVHHVDRSKGPNGETSGDTFIFQEQPAGTKYKAYTPYLLIGSGTIPDVMNVQVDRPLIGVEHGTNAPGGGTIILTPYDVIQNPNATTITDKAGVKWTFAGTTENISTTLAYSYNAWNLLNNVWRPVTPKGPSGFIKYYRSFIASNKPGVSAKEGFNIELVDNNGIVTSIDGTEIDNDEPINNVETRIYTISGQYVGKDFNTLPKGIYILNGKKVVK